MEMRFTHEIYYTFTTLRLFCKYAADTGHQICVLQIFIQSFDLHPQKKRGHGSLEVYDLLKVCPCIRLRFISSEH